MKNCQNASRLVFNVQTRSSLKFTPVLIEKLALRAAGKSKFLRFLQPNSVNISEKVITGLEEVFGRNGRERCMPLDKNLLNKGEALASLKRGDFLEQTFSLLGRTVSIDRGKCHIRDESCSCKVCIEEIEEASGSNDSAEIPEYMGCMTFNGDLHV